jgi:hypothetical protein
MHDNKPLLLITNPLDPVWGSPGGLGDVEMKCFVDTAMGRCPKLKSGEFFISTSGVEEQVEILCLKPPKKCYTVWEHDPGARRRIACVRTVFVAVIWR